MCMTVVLVKEILAHNGHSTTRITIRTQLPWYMHAHGIKVAVVTPGGWLTSTLLASPHTAAFPTEKCTMGTAGLSPPRLRPPTRPWLWTSIRP